MFIENECFEKTLKKISIEKLASIKCAYYVCGIVLIHHILREIPISDPY